MVVTYTSASKVAALLAFNQTTGFSATTVPTTTQVETMINEAEDYIDATTNHAWRTVTVGDANNGIYEFPSIQRYYGTDFYRRYWSMGIPIYLNHRFVKTLSSGSGDVFGVWNGSTYEDWLADKTEGRANDYWMDNQNGILYIRTSFSAVNYLKSIRLVYRYGEATVPKDIQDATNKLVGMKILTSNRFVPEGLSDSQRAQEVDQWNKDIENILHRRRELVLIRP